MIDNRTNLIAKPAPRPATPRPATDPTGDQWWRERWTIAFTRNINGNRWGYSIYSDFSRNGSLNSPNEVAPDPQNPNRLLTASIIVAIPSNSINNTAEKTFHFVAVVLKMAIKRSLLMKKVAHF